MTVNSPGVAPSKTAVQKAAVTANDLDKALGKTYRAKEIHINKDAYQSIRDAGSSHAVGAKDMPVVEKALGSTKQIGSYRDTPVYSHGREKDHVYIQGEGDSKGWFKDGDTVSSPPKQAPLAPAKPRGPVVIS